MAPKEIFSPETYIGVEKAIKGEEDRYLQQRRYTARSRIDPRLPEKLDLFHTLRLRIIPYPLLHSLYLRPERLHLGAAQIAAVYKRGSDQTDEQGQQKD